MQEREEKREKKTRQERERNKRDGMGSGWSGAYLESNDATKLCVLRGNEALRSECGHYNNTGTIQLS